MPGRGRRHAGLSISSGQRDPQARPLRAWQFSNPLGHVAHAVEHGAAAGKNDAFHQVLIHADAGKLGPDVEEQLFRPGLQNFVQLGAAPRAARDLPGDGTSIRLLSAVSPMMAQPYRCFRASASSTTL